MPLFRFDNAVVLFIHVPKTGGSSIEAALRRMGGRPALLSETTHGYGGCTPQHMQAEVLQSFVPEAFYDMRFAVVRDPQSRLISEFKMRRAGRKLRGLRPIGFAAWVRQTFARYAKNPYVFDNHIRPQTELIPPGTRTFKFEDGLEAVLEHVSKELESRPPKIPHLRTGEAASVKVSDDVAEKIAAFYREDYSRFGYSSRAPHDVARPSIKPQ